MTILKLQCLNLAGLSFWKSASRKVYAIDKTKEKGDEVVVVKDECEEHVTNAHSQGMI